MKTFVKWIMDRTIIPMLRYAFQDITITVRDIETGQLSKGRVDLSEPQRVTITNLAPEYQGLGAWRYPRLLEKVTSAELEKSVELIRANLDHVYLAPTDRDIRRYCMGHVPRDGLALEFGVFNAESTNYLAHEMYIRGDTRILHGFDSFEGLSDDGAGWVWEKGRFDLQGNLPAVSENIRLYKGWIDDTLPVFLKDHPDETIAFIHVDVDIYGPAKTILSLCKDRLRPGSIILFDELIGYAGWRFHEYKALTETFSESEYEYIAFSDFYQAAIRIK